MKKVLFFLLVVCFTGNIFGQLGKKKEQEVNIVIHNVKMGETVKTISRKYLVDPSEIYKYNKYAVEGVSQGMALQIPVPVKQDNRSEQSVRLTGKEDIEMEESSSVTTTTVVKTTGGSKSNAPVKTETKQVTPVKSDVETKVVQATKPVQTKVSQPVKEVETKVLQETKTVETKVAQVIKPVVNTTNGSDIQHTVQPKETLYSLARTYGVSVDEIKANNPTLEQTGLQIGQVVNIKSTKTAPSSAAPSPSTTLTTSSVSEYTVQPKETLYSLSKRFNISVEKIHELNPDVAQNGLKIGQVIKLK